MPTHVEEVCYEYAFCPPRCEGEDDDDGEEKNLIDQHLGQFLPWFCNYIHKCVTWAWRFDEDAWWWQLLFNPSLFQCPKSSRKQEKHLQLQRVFKGYPIEKSSKRETCACFFFLHLLMFFGLDGRILNIDEILDFNVEKLRYS